MNSGDKILVNGYEATFIKIEVTQNGNEYLHFSVKGRRYDAPFLTHRTLGVACNSTGKVKFGHNGMTLAIAA